MTGQSAPAALNNVHQLIETGTGQSERIVSLLVASIRPSPYQVRSGRDQEHIEALASSIKDNELTSPVLVRPIGIEGEFELVCGWNRWESHKLLKRERIDCFVRHLTDEEAAKMSLADNLQRRELTDWEICQGINLLRNNGFATTDQEVARIFGRPRAFITKTKAFNDLSESAKTIVAANPNLFGTNLAAELKAEGHNKKNTALVEQALQRVVDGSLTQAGVISWLRAKTTPISSAPLKDSTFTINDRKVRIAVYRDTIRISCKGMDGLKIEAGLQEALKTLL